MFKKVMLLTMSAVMVFSMSACNKSKEETKETQKATEEVATTVEKATAKASDNSSDDGTNNSDFDVADVSTAGWTMSVENVQISSELSNTSEVLGYSSASTNTFVKKADEDKTYVLIKMAIKKDGATENITWDKMLLTDADGTKYNRIDDSFIDSLSWMRISGTDLNFGSYEGWFAYQIPEDKSKSGLTLEYEFKDGSLEYKVN